MGLGPHGKAKRQWTFPTTRPKLAEFAETMGSLPVVLEASTAGKAVATGLNEVDAELHMAAPNKVALISKTPAKIDDWDSATLAHLYLAGFLPECYIPPP